MDWARIVVGVAMALASAVAGVAQTLDNGTVRAELRDDPVVGLTLDSLGCSGEPPAFSTVAQNESDAGLWQLVLTPRDGGDSFVLGPEQATEYQVSWDADGLGVEGTWNGVSGGSTADTFDVVLHVRAERGEPWLRWTADVTRTAGTTASLDTVRFPITRWAAPVAPASNETLLEAQRRARVLIPSDGKAFIAASPLDVLCSLGTSYDLEHPGAGTGMGQFIGWAALANMDPGAVAFRHVLVLGSLDFSGYSKVFHHAWTAPSDTAPAYTWWHGARPAFDGNEPDGWDDEYHSPYPAITGVVTARTDAFWYAVVEPYREAFAASPQAPPPLAGNQNLGVGRRPFWVTGHIQLGSGQSGEPLYRGFQRQADRVRAIFEPVGVSGALPLSHWQTYLQGGGGVATPDTPVADTIDSGVATVIGDMEADGYTVSVYVWGSGLSKASHWYQDLFSVEQPEAEARRRDGSPFSDTEMIFDLGDADIGQYFVDHMVSDVTEAVGSSGIYLDTLTGTGASLSYGSPDHPGHGGDYWMAGKRRFLDAAHERMVQRAVDEGKSALESFVLSEAPDEGIPGHLDLTQDGYGWPPQLMRFYETAALGTTPNASLDWSPPLWSAIYHEWIPVTQLGMPFDNVALATSPYQDGYTGLDSEQMVDLWCFVHALYAVAGYRIELNDFAEYGNSPLVDAGPGGVLEVDPVADPDGAGLEIAAFLRRVWAAYDDRGQGAFLLRGRMVQPLDEDFTDPEVVLVTNPIAALGTGNPAHFVATYPAAVTPTVDPSTGQVTPDLGDTAMPVPAVLTSVWQLDGDTALVAIGWTGSARTHRAGLPAGAYFPPGSRYYLETPEETWLGPFETDGADLDLHWSAGVTAPPEIHFGPVPPRSVQVLRLRLVLPGDDNGDRRVGTDDIVGMVAEIFDEDGRAAMATAGSTHLGSPNDDLDGDGAVTAADLAGMIPQGSTPATVAH